MDDDARRTAVLSRARENLARAERTLAEPRPSGPVWERPPEAVRLPKDLAPLEVRLAALERSARPPLDIDKLSEAILTVVGMAVTARLEPFEKRLAELEKRVRDLSLRGAEE